ncbi:hypothetical protein [Streptomyces sp. NPDC057253]|uniref:hypothetical protein n=1 Tax=Streptomyces sp. NPDC057253 TaxID=3346069 RepID=UPI0036251C81
MRDVEVAWGAFCEFLQVGIDGIEGPEDDGDGFIVQWGRWDWNDGRPALSFGRQLAVSAGHGPEGLEWQPEYWQVELQLVFAEDPAWADLDSLGRQDTGFRFDGIGVPRAAALGGIRSSLRSYPQLAALWQAEPLRCDLTLERAG